MQYIVALDKSSGKIRWTDTNEEVVVTVGSLHFDESCHGGVNPEGKSVDLNIGDESLVCGITT